MQRESWFRFAVVCRARPTFNADGSENLHELVASLSADQASVWLVMSCIVAPKDDGARLLLDLHALGNCSEIEECFGEDCSLGFIRLKPSAPEKWSTFSYKIVVKKLVPGALYSFQLHDSDQVFGPAPQPLMDFAFRAAPSRAQQYDFT